VKPLWFFVAGCIALLIGSALHDRKPDSATSQGFWFVGGLGILVAAMGALIQ
jgi:hypothetical protein